MRWLWLAIIVLTGIPVILVAAVVNPFVVLAAGIERWREWVARLHPYRYWLTFAVAAFGISIVVYTARYT